MFSSYVNTVFDCSNRNLKMISNLVVLKSTVVHHERYTVRLIKAINSLMDVF